jgi:hypothetical protein
MLFNRSPSSIETDHRLTWTAGYPGITKTHQPFISAFGVPNRLALIGESLLLLSPSIDLEVVSTNTNKWLAPYDIMDQPASPVWTLIDSDLKKAFHRIS